MADLPSGAVTFLFTDIEGSTLLVRQLRDRYGDVLAEHQRLLREAFSKHSGHEIDTQGDAFFYVFGSAHEAVQAAAEGQQALSGHSWP
jgi:class 3 adenylate cyclase